MADHAVPGPAGGETTAEGLLARITRLLARGGREPAGGKGEGDGDDEPLSAGIVADDAEAVARLLDNAQVVEARREWPDERLAILESLWGPGFVTPTGEAALPDLCRPLDLGPDRSLLMLGAGLGGAARFLARTRGVWVTGMELSEELADLGMQRSIDAKLTRKAPVSPVDPESLEVRPRSFHHVLSDGFLYLVRDKPRLIGQLGQGLKPGGRLVLLDLVRGEAARQGAWRRWQGVERRAVEPATVAELRNALQAAGLTIESEDDWGPRYRRTVLGGWARFVTTLEKGRVPRRRAAWIVRECEYWLRRLAAVEEGSLRVLGLVARKEN